MRVVLQRVSRARVTVGERVTGEIGKGFLLLVGFTASDGDEAVAWMADKVLGLRIFPDDDGKMNRALDEVGGGVLVVSQFTLYGDARKGRRPSFVDAAPPRRRPGARRAPVGRQPPRTVGAHVTCRRRG